MPNSTASLTARPIASPMPITPAPAKSLAQVLGETKRVKDLVAEAAEELSSVNASLKQEVSTPDTVQNVGDTIERSEAVEGKVQDAAAKLSVVHAALAVEVEARHALEKKLESITQESESATHAAFHDAMTGLPNRALFINRLEHGLAQAKRHGFTLAVMFVDLDGFKAINDQHGHAVGDAVLQSVADRLQENTRADDTVSRYGGDEFLYLLMSIDDDKHVQQIAEKIAAAIQKPCSLSVGNVVVRSSMGISIFPKDGDSAAALIEMADSAMYQAKRAKVDFAFA